MPLTRRTAALGLLSTVLAACAATGTPVARSTLRPVPNPAFDSWVSAFRGRALSAGIAPSMFDAAFADAGYLPGVVERDRNQTEFTRTLEDYLAIVASEERVAEGRAAFRRERATLNAIETRFGVPAEVVAAIWGVESAFGTRRGDIPVISATATLAFDGRRGAFFEQQLIAALRILQDGDTTPDRMVGSWAGAMGHTQFIPTSFRAYAVDFTGDGRRDIWSDDPTDALASAAAYLDRFGWRSGQPWGVEVTAPAGIAAGREVRRPVSDWAARGVRAIGGGAPPNHGPAALVQPDPGGPAFLLFSNFTVITRYNNSTSYAIGVGYLSDRIAGDGPLRTPFPPDRFGLTIDDRRELQRGLTRAGFDTGGADGVIGPRTEAAIRDFQRARGLPVTGAPSRDLLAALR
jgi:lytic murein transglycosylase